MLSKTETGRKIFVSYDDNHREVRAPPSQSISRSLFALRHNQKLHEGNIIEREKQKIQAIVKVIASNSIHQRVVLPKLGKSP